MQVRYLVLPASPRCPLPTRFVPVLRQLPSRKPVSAVHMVLMHLMQAPLQLHSPFLLVQAAQSLQRQRELSNGWLLAAQEVQATERPLPTPEHLTLSFGQHCTLHPLLRPFPRH